MDMQDFAARTANRDLLYGPSDAIWDWCLRPGLWLIGVGLVPVTCIVAVLGSLIWESAFTFQSFMLYYGLSTVALMGMARLAGWIKHWRRLEGWSLMTGLVALGLGGSMALVDGWAGFLPLTAAFVILVVTDSLSAFRRSIPSWAAAPLVPFLLYMLVTGLAFLGGLILQIPEG